MRARFDNLVEWLARPDRYALFMGSIATACLLCTVAVAVVAWVYVDSQGKFGEGEQRDALTAAQVKKIAQDVYNLQRPPKREIRSRFEIGLRECLSFGPCRRDLSKRLSQAAGAMDTPRLLDQIPSTQRPSAPNTTPGATSPRRAPAGTPPPSSPAPSSPSPTTPAPTPTRPSPTPPTAPVPDLVKQVERIVNDLLPDGVPKVNLP